MKIRFLLCKKTIFTLLLMTLIGSSVQSQELLTNGDFETANVLGDPNALSTEFLPWNLYDVNTRGTNDLRIETTDVYEGNNAAVIKSNGKKGKISQITNIGDNSKTYIFSCYLKPGVVSYVDKPFNLRVKAFDSSTGEQVEGIISESYRTHLKNEGYVRFGFPFNYKEVYDQIEVHIQCHQGGEGETLNGTYLIDNASLVVATGYENMSFEEGVDYFWRKTLKGSPTISNDTENVLTGNKAAQMILSSSADTASIKNNYRKPIEFGKQYTVSAMAKVLADNTNADSLKIVTKTYGADHLFIGSTGTKYDISDAFQEYTNTITPTTDDKYMAFEITVYNNQATTYIIDDVDVTESIANSTNDIEADKIRIFPNPASDFINIESLNNEMLDVKIYDISGNFAFQKTSVQSGERIDIQMLNKGVYIIKVSDKQGTIISKFVKK